MHLSVKTRATVALVLRSASLNWVFWKSASFCPNALRSGGVFDGPVDHRFGHGGRADRLREPFLRQLRHHQREALALRAEHVGGGDADILEEQLGGILRLHADLFEISSALETRPVALDDEQRHAFGAGVAVGLGREHDEIAELAVGDEDLLAVDDEVVAIANRAGADRLEVAAGMRLRHAERADGFAATPSSAAIAAFAPRFRTTADRSRRDRYGSESPDRSRRTRHNSSNTTTSKR